jgi:prepilin-type processing-associated H-X9-DG protein
MLLPALRRAREEAKSLSCKNNLKQMALSACNMYTNDFNGWLPRYAYPWTELVGPYMINGFTPNEDVSSSSVLAMRKKSMKIFNCPSSVDTNLIWTYDGVYYGNGGPTNYGFQVRCGLFKTGEYGPVSMVKVRKPSKAMLIADLSPDLGTLNNKEYFYNLNELGFPHIGKCNMLYLDGHAGQETPASFNSLDYYYWQWARYTGE